MVLWKCMDCEDVEEWNKGEEPAHCECGGEMYLNDPVIDKINNMSHIEMCRLWRFAPSGHPYFDSTQPYYKIFRARLYDHFGGFTPEISKEIGFKLFKFGKNNGN